MPLAGPRKKYFYDLLSRLYQRVSCALRTALHTLPCLPGLTIVMLTQKNRTARFGFVLFFNVVILYNQNNGGKRVGGKEGMNEGREGEKKKVLSSSILDTICKLVCEII